MNRKDFLRRVRRLNPDKGGDNEEIQTFMDQRKKMKHDIFEQDDVLSKRKDIPNSDSDEFYTIFERFDNGIKIV